MPGLSFDILSDRVFRTIQQFCPEADRDDLSWHWLLQGGFLAGQKFLCGDLQAIWLKKNETVEVLDGQGQKLAQFAWPESTTKDVSAIIGQIDNTPERHAA